MLFVFGYRARSLRQRKVSELIHNSERFRDVEQCRVSVYFQFIVDHVEDPHAYDVVPDSEFVVTRAAYRNNQSSYYLNGRASSYNEVTDLLKERGIDLTHNRFLILQGEVEQIAMLKPKAQSEHEEGLLEYLEDIIGSNRFKEQIDASGRQVEQLNEERGEKLNRAKAVEAEKEALEGAKREAEAFVELENELVHARARHFQLQRAEAHGGLEEARGQAQELEARLAAERERLAASVGAFQTAEAQIKAEETEHRQLEAAVETAKAEFAAFERKDVKHREDAKHAKLKEKKLMKQLEKEEHACAEQETWAKNYAEDTVRIERELRDAQATLSTEEEALEAIYESLKGETASVQAELEAQQRAQAPCRKRVDEAQSALELTRSELELLQRKTQEAQAKLADVRRDAAAAESDQAEKAAAAAALQKRHAELAAGLEKVQRALDAARADERGVTERVRELRGRVEEGRTAMQAARSRGKVLDSLMQLKTKGRIAGILGRLGDLGTIAAEYDVAVSTAAGSTLNHVVVDTTETAQKCVELLRTNGLGRATFIILEKLQPARPLGAEGAPEGAPRLFDLITPSDARYAPAFYHAVHDTLVATDLEQASRIAYGSAKRHRVVTLQGQLIEASGAMSGGGATVARGGMSSHAANEDVSPDEVARLECSLERESERLLALREQIKQLEPRSEALSAEVAKIDTAARKASMDAEAAATRAAGLRSAMASLGQRADATAALSPEEHARLGQLQQQQARQEQALQQAKIQAAAFDGEIARLQARIMEIGGVRLRAQKSKVDGLREQLDSLQRALTKSQVAQRTAQRAADKARQAAAQVAADLAQARADIERGRAEFEAIEQGAVKVMEAFRQAQRLMEEKQEVISTKRQQLVELKRAADQGRATEVDLVNQLELQTRALRDNQAKEAHWQRQLSELRLQRIVEGDEGGIVEEPVPEMAPGELAALDRDRVRADIAEREEQLAAMKPNMAAIREFRKKEAEYQVRLSELAESTERRDRVRAEHDALRKQRLDEFMTGFGMITMKLKEMYQMITLGGDAELELVDSLDPFSEGIVFSVRPPKKSWKNISNLSGGEKVRACRPPGVSAAAHAAIMLTGPWPWRIGADAQLAGVGLCAAPLQADAAVCHG